MLDPKVWIVIPAYNEAKNIKQVIKSLLSLTSNIVVVNDCSTDCSQKILKQLPVYCLNHMVNRGQGAALQTGNDFALQKGAEIIVHFDADGQMQVKDIATLIEPLLTGQAEISLGSRFLDNKSKVPLTKKWLRPAI